MVVSCQPPVFWVAIWAKPATPVLVGDDLGVGLDFVPGRRRIVRVEAGLGEQGPVVGQGHAVRRDRHCVDLAVGVLAVDEDVRVELVGVAEGADARVDVDDLVLGDQALAVGERDVEDGRQRAAGELSCERRGGPVVLIRHNGDPRVLGFELGDLQVQGVGCFLGRARAEHADGDRHGLVGGRRRGRGVPEVAPGACVAAAVGLGVLVELQALTVTMANAAIASALNLRLGLAVISSLTLMSASIWAVL